MKKLLTSITVLIFSVSSFSQGLWTQKATCPGTNDLSFTIGSLGYIYTGAGTGNFYAYDPVANTWTPKADFPGIARQAAAGFATTSFGYVGTGAVGNSGLSDFYQYNPSTDTWTAVANYPDSGYSCFSFAIGNTGYVCGGLYDTMGYATFTKLGFSYDESTNTWTAIAPMPINMESGFSAVANSMGYCGFGNVDSVYQYDPSLDSWTRMNTDTFASYQDSKVTFVMNNKIYLYDYNAYADHGGIRVFDPVANSWSLIYAFPSLWLNQCIRPSPIVGLTIAGYGYLGASLPCAGAQFWEYDTAHYFTITSVSPDTICLNDSFTVSFSSNLTFGSGNTFTIKAFGNSLQITSDSVAGTSAGTYTFGLPVSQVPYAVNTTDITVLSSNPPNQTGYTPWDFYVKSSPVEGPLGTDFRSCGGSALLLYRSNSPFISNVWTSNPAGVNDSTYSLSFTPTQPTTTIYAYSVYTSTAVVSSTPQSSIYMANRPSISLIPRLVYVRVPVPLWEGHSHLTAATHGPQAVLAPIVSIR